MTAESRQPYLAGRVKDVMTVNPVTIRDDGSIRELIDLFVEHHYHGVPVLDSRERLVGIVRDSEILSMFATRDPFVGEYRTVRDIMHYPPLVIGPSETIQRAAMKMFVDGTRFLVVVSREGAVVGVVTRIDLIRGISWREEEPG